MTCNPWCSRLLISYVQSVLVQETGCESPKCCRMSRGITGKTHLTTMPSSLAAAVTGQPKLQLQLAKWPGVAAYLACGWCRFQGQKFAGSAATRFLGYDKPVQHDISGGGAWHRVGDKELLVSDDLQHARARLVEQHELLPSVAGCTLATL